MTRIAIVIPYYQSAPGILRKAVASICAQSVLPAVRLEILVVDDASPVAAEAELAGVVLAEGVELRIIRRTNGGPSAARNTGLDQVSAEAEVVAFIDSDDAWTPRHLERALAALDTGADMFFEDHVAVDGQSYFRSLAKAEADPPGRRVAEALGVPFEVRTLPAAPGEAVGDTLYSLSGEDAVIAQCRVFLAHLSTLVIRRSTLAGIRFDGGLRAAGEDYFYTFRLALESRRVMFSDAVGTVQGRGVNIYFSNVTWGTSASVAILRDNLLCVLQMQALVADRPRAAGEIAGLVAERRRHFAAGWLTTLRRTRRPHLADIAAVTTRAPLFPLHLPLLLLKAALSTGAATAGRRPEPAA